MITKHIAFPVIASGANNYLTFSFAVRSFLLHAAFRLSVNVSGASPTDASATFDLYRSDASGPGELSYGVVNPYLLCGVAAIAQRKSDTENLFCFANGDFNLGGIIVERYETVTAFLGLGSGATGVGICYLIYAQDR